MAVEVANPLTHEYLTGEEQSLLRFRIATETSYNLDVCRLMIGASMQSEGGKHIDQLMEDTLGLIQTAPEEGILQAPAPLVDAALQVVVLDTQLHDNICDRMGRPLAHRRVPMLLDSWVYPKEITPVTAHELLTVGETEAVIAEIARDLRTDFRYITAVEQLRIAGAGEATADSTLEELSENILTEALKFLHARSRGLVDQAPGILVDAGWHALIKADTLFYRALCHRMRQNKREEANLLHHVPNPLLGEGPVPTSEPIVKNIVAELDSHGYAPNDALWFKPTGCLCGGAPGGHPSC